MARVCFCVLCAAVVLPAVPPLIYGQTQPLSPNSGQSSTTSAAHLTTWNELSGRFKETLETHERTLTELSEKLKTSESSLTQSTLLLEKLSGQNGDLRNYNDRIATRMYERDTDLVDAYDRINRLEKAALKLTVAAVSLAGALAVMVILAIRRLI